MTTEAHRFLHSLWPENVPDRTCIQLWTIADKKTHSFMATDPAAERVGSCDGDIYIAAGLAPRMTKPSNTRTAASAIVGIPGIWADIDVNGGPTVKTNAAPDIKSAIKLSKSIVAPTLIINSGYGIQAWWLFEQPWLFYSPDDNKQAARIVQAFQSMLRAKAKEAGYTIDSTHDLARLMRIPGSFNCKGVEKMSVTIVSDDGPLHGVQSIEDLVQEHLVAVVAEQSRLLGDVEFDVRADGNIPLPLAKINELKYLNDDFARAWDHGQGYPGRTPHKSMNEWEMSIANYLAHAGFTDQEMADCLAFHRIRFDPGDPKGKATRRDYLALTISKAKSSVDHDDEIEMKAAEREHAEEQLVKMADRGEEDPVKAASLFSRVMGGPEVKRLIQDGIDPRNVQFRLELADGSDVPVGSAANLLDQARVREVFAVVTGHLIPQVKGDKWHKVIQALLRGATVNREDSRVSVAQSWLEGYLEGMISTDRDAACQASDPFEHDDYIYVHAGALNAYLRRQSGERMKDIELVQYLQATGFERKTVSYTRDDKKPSSRSYWRIPKEQLPWL